jgi:hypothetical protein
MSNKDQDNYNQDGKDTSDDAGSKRTEHNSNTSIAGDSNRTIENSTGERDDKEINSNFKEGESHNEEVKTTEFEGIHDQENDEGNKSITQDSEEQIGIMTGNKDSIIVKQAITVSNVKDQEGDNKEEINGDEILLYSEDHRDTGRSNNQEEEYKENKKADDKLLNSNHNPEITGSQSQQGTNVFISENNEQELEKQMEIMVQNTMEENNNINKENTMETDQEHSYSENEHTEEEPNGRTQKNRRDDGSISSKKTVRNTNRHSDSEGSKIYVESPESEDDENTVDSSNSTQYNKKPTNRWIPPKSIRYQIGINLAPIDLKSLQKEFEGPNKDGITSMDTFDRIRTHLQELFAETKKIDKYSKFITWKDTKIYRVLEGYKDNIPNTNAGVSQFFDGIRLKRDQGRQYIRFRLHSKNEKKMEAELHEWARLSNHSFYRCIIQEEHSTPIGWLLYSSQYTNTQHLSSYLQRETGFEWGFKLGSITKSDEKEDGKPVTWKNRLKAMIVHVPTHKAEVAITKISLLLQAKKAEQNQVPLFYQRYLFIQQENTMVDINSRLQYKHILSRQRSHLDSIKSKFILSIDVDMDKRLETQEGGYFSLREMILAINNRQDGKNWDPVPLFHSIDFCPDSSKVWIGNSMGPGGPGHIITYYNVMEAEALQMIRGLGIYLGKIYGYDNIVECFSRDHWQSLEGWKFSKKKWKFTTPETRQMKDNLKLDSNKLMEGWHKGRSNQPKPRISKP